MKTKQDLTNEFQNIKLGTHYNKYLGHNYKSKEIEPKNPKYVKSYLIQNNDNAPLFKGILNILNNGKAIFNANYSTYSGVKNKYENYFNKEGLEIIHINNSTMIEKKYFKEC